MNKLIYMLLMLTPAISQATEPNILTGTLYYNPISKTKAYRVNRISDNARQIKLGLPVTELDREVDEQATSRTIRYQYLTVDSIHYGQDVDCVEVPSGITCVDKEGKKHRWFKDPTYKQNDIRAWRLRGYASSACFIQEKRKTCQTFY